jgi:hypothetical protein
VLAALSLCLLPVTAPFAAMFILSVVAIFFPGNNKPPMDLELRIFFILLKEGFFAAFVLCLLGLVWAISTPLWVERLVNRFAWQAMFSLALMMLILSVLFALQSI